MNRASPVYLTYILKDRSQLVACWNWKRMFHAGELPEAWELVPEGDVSELEQRCLAQGYRLIYLLASHKEEIWNKIQIAQKGPQRTRKQQAKFKAREKRKQEQAQAQAAWLKQVAQEYDDFQACFRGLSQPELRREYRRLARKHHPDIGGSATSFQALDKAYKEALARIDSRI